MNRLFLCTLLMIGACATTHPERVPELTPSALPALVLPEMKPQTVSLSITNSRKINAKAGNTEAVIAVVRNALLDSIARGGLTFKADAKNKLTLEISDCENGDENLECANLRLGLRAGRYSVEVSGNSQNGYYRERSGNTIPGMGDISKAYQDGLVMLLKGLPDQWKRVRDMRN